MKSSKSGLYAIETRYQYTEVKCIKCNTTIFQGCSLGLTVSDIKKCPKCGAPINVLEKWEER